MLQPKLNQCHTEIGPPVKNCKELNIANDRANSINICPLQKLWSYSENIVILSRVKPARGRGVKILQCYDEIHSSLY